MGHGIKFPINWVFPGYPLSFTDTYQWMYSYDKAQFIILCITNSY